MNVFVAGGSGTIGVPLVRALAAAGHQVTALTRSGHKRDELRAAGASVAVADALNREALMAAVRDAHPTHVIHQLTALPKGGPRRASDLTPTNRLRIDGTRNLLDAAIAAGARRFVVGSFAPLSPRGPAPPQIDDEAAAAVRSMEHQVLDASRRGLIEGIVLRYGLFYGLETPSTIAMIDMVRKRRLPVVRGDAGQLPVIHIDDAVSATVRALDWSRWRQLRHRRRSRGEHDRDRRGDRGIHRRAAAAQSARLAAAAGRAVHGADDLDRIAAGQHRSESGAWLAAEVSDDARRSGADVSTRGVNDGPGRFHTPIGRCCSRSRTGCSEARRTRRMCCRTRGCVTAAPIDRRSGRRRLSRRRSSRASVWID